MRICFQVKVIGASHSNKYAHKGNDRCRFLPKMGVEDSLSPKKLLREQVILWSRTEFLEACEYTNPSNVDRCTSHKLIDLWLVQRSTLEKFGARSFSD